MQMNNDLIEAHRMAAAALEAGQQLATRAATKPIRGALRGQLAMELIGDKIADTGAFWAGACQIEAKGNVGSVEALAQAHKLAAAKLLAGDYGFVCESLIGQSQWCSVIAAKLAAVAQAEEKPDRLSLLLKLALAAQRQAAQALCSAAALNKLQDTDTVVDVGRI